MMTNVKQMRKQKGMSQVDLAASASVTQSTISGIENGSLNVTMETLDKIAGALEVTVVDLISEADELPFPADFVRNFRKLPEADQRTVLEMTRLLLSRSS